LVKTAGLAVLLVLVAPVSDSAYSCLLRGSATMVVVGLELLSSYMIAATVVSRTVAFRRSDLVPAIPAEFVVLGLIGAGLSTAFAVRLIETRCI
jgi:hypothetical protein